MPVNKYDVLGKRLDKIEARQKATGKLKFTGDLKISRYATL